MVPRVIGQTEATKKAKSHRAPKKEKTNRAELLSKCDVQIRGFIIEILDEAERREWTISWGTRSFSLRIPDKDGIMNSVLYCYSPGDSPKSTSRLECYLDNSMRGTECEVQLSERYLAIDGFVKQGQYTFTLQLTPETLESASRAMSIIWEIPDLILNV
jgi:hypothetical protein